MMDSEARDESDMVDICPINHNEGESTKGVQTFAPKPPVPKSTSNGKRDTNASKAFGSSLRRIKSSNSFPNEPRVRTVKASPSLDSNSSNNNNKKNVDNSSSIIKKMQKLTLSKRYKTPRNNKSQNQASKNGLNGLIDVVKLINEGKAKNIIVMTGAGISTPSGIPDFRSPGTGLYANLQQYQIPYPQAIFDIEYFETTPKPFYVLAKELYPSGKYLPNYVHYFLRVLHEKGLLLKLYTQNIDGLERMAGIPDRKIVEAHGSFLTASCIRCNRPYPKDEVQDAVFSEKIPRCKFNNCMGLVKPDIVFFGEDLPRKFYFYLKDFPQADLLLVLGTSLAVEPFAGIVDATRFHVPRVLFNRVAVGPFTRKRRISDHVEKGDILEKIVAFSSMLGWQKDIEDLMRADNIPIVTVSQVRQKVTTAKEKSGRAITCDNNIAPLSSSSESRALANQGKASNNPRKSHPQKEYLLTNSLPNTPLLNRPKNARQSFATPPSGRGYRTGIHGQGSTSITKENKHNKFLPNIKFIHTGVLGGCRSNDKNIKQMCNNFFMSDEEESDLTSSEESSSDDD